LKTANIKNRINNQISASELRVLDATGKQLGVMTTQKALEKAYEQNLDLIEIAPTAKPPVAKIMELGKFKYEEGKRAQKEKRGVKGGDTKEIRFTPFIAESDYQTRMKRIREFFGERNKVKIVVKFGGRQMNSKAFGYNLVKRIITELGPDTVVDTDPKFLGRNLITTISTRTTKKATPSV
jgi:translation initiation factor IF-3